MMDRQDIFDQMGLNEIKRRLGSYPAMIKNKKEERDNLQRQLDNVELERQELEAEALLKVQGSNAEQRKANLSLDLKSDEFYQAKLRAVQAAGNKLKQCQNELDFLQDEYKSTRYWAQIAAGELGFWGGAEDRAIDEEQRGFKQDFRRTA